jgi:hypothetical protein
MLMARASKDRAFAYIQSFKSLSQTSLLPRDDLKGLSSPFRSGKLI